MMWSDDFGLYYCCIYRNFMGDKYLTTDNIFELMRSLDSNCHFFWTPGGPLTSHIYIQYSSSSILVCAAFCSMHFSHNRSTAGLTPCHPSNTKF